MTHGNVSLLPTEQKGQRIERYKMKKDSFLQKELWKYGIHASSIFNKKFNEDYFLYLHKILKEKEIVNIIKTTMNEINLFSKENKLFDETISNKDKPKNVIDAEELIEDIRKDFKKALTSDHKWSDGFEKLYFSHKDI